MLTDFPELSSKANIQCENCHGAVIVVDRVDGEVIIAHKGEHYVSQDEPASLLTHDRKQFRCETFTSRGRFNVISNIAVTYLKFFGKSVPQPGRAD